MEPLGAKRWSLSLPKPKSRNPVFTKREQESNNKISGESGRKYFPASNTRFNVVEEQQGDSWRVDMA